MIWLHPSGYRYRSRFAVAASGSRPTGSTGGGPMVALETEHMSFGSADEIREVPNGRAEILESGEGAIGRLVLERAALQGRKQGL